MKAKPKSLRIKHARNPAPLIGPDELQDSTPLERIYPAMPDRHGKEAVTRSKQNTAYHEMGRLSGYDSEGVLK